MLKSIIPGVQKLIAMDIAGAPVSNMTSAYSRIRLNKPAVLLQYEGEPHHLKQYPNKLD